MKDTTNKDLRFSATKPEMNTLSSILHPLIQQRWTMNKYKTQATNRLRHLLSSTFPEGEVALFNYLLKILHFYPTPQRIIEAGEKELVKAGLSKAKAAAMVECAKTTVGIPAERYEEVIKIMALQRLDAEQKVEVLTEQITKQLKDHPYTPILLSFPGVSYVAAGTLLATIGNIEQWKSKSALRKGMGIYPVIAASGSNAGKVKLGTEGSRDTRRVLYQVVFSCCSPVMPENDFRDYEIKCKNRGMSGKKAILAAAGLLIEILYHCLKENEEYEYRGNRK
jgi:transposase